MSEDIYAVQHSEILPDAQVHPRLRQLSAVFKPDRSSPYAQVFHTSSYGYWIRVSQTTQRDHKILEYFRVCPCALG